MAPVLASMPTFSVALVRIRMDPLTLRVIVIYFASRVAKVRERLVTVS